MVKKKSAKHSEEKPSEKEHSDNAKKSDSQKIISDISKNYWAVAAIILGILLVAVLIYNSSSVSSSSTTITEQQATQKVMDFLNARVGNGSEIVNVTDSGSLYEVVVSYQGQEIPLYITKDGENLVPQIVSLTESQTQAQTPTQTQQTPPKVPKTDKPIVDLFVMAYCPYGTQEEKGIIPVVNLLKDKIDFNVKFVYYSMHPSQGEVQENTRQHCIQKEQNAKYIPYLTCFLQAGDSKGCLESTGIDTTKLDICYNATDKEFNITANLEDKSSWLSGAYPKYNVDLEENQLYGVGGSPTLVINGVQASSGRDSASLLNTICGAFNTAPEECTETLSSAAPSPGFGFDTSASTPSTDATCG